MRSLYYPFISYIFVPTKDYYIFKHTYYEDLKHRRFLEVYFWWNDKIGFPEGAD